MNGDDVAITVAVVRAAVCLSSRGEYTVLIGIPGHAAVFAELPVTHAAAWALTAQVGVPINAEPLEEAK